MSLDIRQEFERDGRVWFRNAITSEELENLKQLSELENKSGARVSSTSPLYKAIASLPFNTKIQKIWPKMEPVRVVAFNKMPSSNWGVPWHQDRVISVEEKADAEGYSNWSQKAGSWHCEPPISLLENMLFVRVHLDDSTEENGAMEIALGSHQEGAVVASEAAGIANTYQREITTAKSGDILVLAMLTLHRSLSSQSKDSRRVLRVDFSPDTLPSPLSWIAQ